MLAALLQWADTRRGFWIFLAGLTGVSALLRLIRIGTPAERVFDEVYSPVFAWKLLHGEAFFDVHPVLVQLPHALGLAVFGDTSLGWRFGPWLWGTLFTVGLGVLGALLTGRRLVGLVAALLATLDIALFVYGRTGLPDMFLLMVFAWALVLFFASCRARTVAQRHLAALGSGILLGSLTATKWFGIGASALVWAWLLFGFRPRPRVRAWLLPVLFLLVPMLTYLLWLVPVVGLGDVVRPAVGEAFFQGPACTFGKGSADIRPPPTTWSSRARHWHCVVWNYHAYLEAEHPYASPWWSWPLLKHPVLFYLDAAEPTRTITATGNPVIWWAGFAAVALTLFSLPPRWRKVDLWLLLGIFGFWLPWALVQRVTFHYHYFLSFTLTLVLLAVWLVRLLDRPALRPTALAFLLLAAGAFVFLYPTATATTAPWIR